MSIDINIAPKSTGLAVEGQTTLPSDLKSAEAKASAPLLGGANLKVTSAATSDLEKLVAQLKNESESAKMSVAQRRISILQTVLDSMAGRISEAQKAAILDAEALEMEKAGLEGELAGLNSDKAAADGRIAMLDAQISALEKQIEQAVKDGADHREKVAQLKEQRAVEQANLDRIEGAIKSVSSKIADIDGKIARCTESIGIATLNEVAAELRTAAGEEKPEVELAESDADRRKADEKAESTDIAKGISKSLDKIDDQIRQALAEAQELVKA